MSFCKYSCNEIKKLKQAIMVLKEENELLKRDNLLKDFNVFNRYYLDELLKEEYYPKLENKKNWFYNIALIDLDNLHNINREQGYEEGDNYIISIVKKIKKVIEENKISARIFRIGGDEFVIIYQPYDYLDLDQIKGITWDSSTFNNKESFKKSLKEMDANIIKMKEQKKIERK